ncbi:MAG: beta-galactosidase trimerization domain-containing protein [Acidobacteria bacterium]|nr:beta-galactosidase trimerization domain-containing protein [Acidobacteriota bacterium]
MLWSQLTLTEDDPPKLDTGFWLDYFRRIHSDAACLSAGGVVAYYPSRIPLHHRSRWLGDKDPFGDLVKGCRKLGMVVIARTDPHAIHQDAADAHPDWIAVDEKGQPRKHWADPALWVTCALGPYNFEFMTAVHREIVSLYGVDGIFSNRWAGHGMCYCRHCQANFRKAAGHGLPRTNNPLDQARRAHIEWRQQRLFELWRLWDAEIRKINPNACFIANAGGGALSNLDMKTIGELAPALFADRQARRGLMAPWANGKNGKEYRAALGRKPIAGIFSVGVEEAYRWKDSVQSDAEIRIWVADGVANGLRPWWTKFSGEVRDPRWLKTVESIYGRLHRWAPYLRNETAAADVAIVYSQQTANYYGGGKAREKVEDHTLGFYQALIEARIPFEMAHDRLLDAAHIDRYRALILPNIAALSDGQCRQLLEYVGRGGSLLATLETSLYNEWGEKRKDFALGDLFGVQYAGRTEGPMQNAYLRLEHAAHPDHPLLKGLEDAPRIIHGVYRLVVTPAATFTSKPLTLIPSYPDLPMEMVYPRVARTEIAEVYLRESGKSRIVYFPWDIDRTFWEVMGRDHGLLLCNAVDWAAGGERPVYVEGPGLLDVTIWKQKSSMTVHLVNLTNPMTMKGPFRELIPVGELKVRLKLPDGAPPRRVQLLAAARTPQTRLAAGWLEVRVPSVLDHEVVALDL